MYLRSLFIEVLVDRLDQSSSLLISLLLNPLISLRNFTVIFLNSSLSVIRERRYNSPLTLSVECLHHVLSGTLIPIGFLWFKLLCLWELIRFLLNFFKCEFALPFLYNFVSLFLRAQILLRIILRKEEIILCCLKQEFTILVKDRVGIRRELMSSWRIWVNLSRTLFDFAFLIQIINRQKGPLISRLIWVSWI